MDETGPVPALSGLALRIASELMATGFEDIHEIGRGGFGIVYRCRQPDLDRVVAVKVLTAEPDGSNRERFWREQRAMGKLSGHPNVVTIYDVGATSSGRPFIVMEYHRRDSLHALIRSQGPIGWEAALPIAIKIAGALETAHRVGMLHRDVKPSNILITDYGEPQLADFGIARIFGGFETADRRVAGSPAFIAPEVITGGQPSRTADVYGLGATLFCAITGHAAYERRSGESVVAQFLRITREPLADVLSGVAIPDDLNDVIAAAMDRDPQSRTSTPGELGEQLRAVEARHELPIDGLPLPDTGDARLHNAGRAPPASRSRTAGRDTAASPLPMRARKKPESKSADTPLGELTSFVGRQHEVAAVRQLFSVSRLVTLIGIGGVGKSRLALRVAQKASRAFPDGVFVVELAALEDPDLLPYTIVDMLGIRDHSLRAPITVLCEHLRQRRLLLVLDSCEHLVGAVASLVDDVLRAAPTIRVLATSQQALRIAGEHLYPVLPLPVPNPAEPVGPELTTRYPSVVLFAERSAALVPDFAITPSNAGAVARLCHQLEGIPLAIELAAARMRVLTVNELERRLDDRFQLLRDGSRNLPQRHQTLQALIDWSSDLCTANEQALWARASVFARDVGVDALEAVCSDDGLPTAAILDAAAALVDKSIFIREERDGQVRFRMLETIRAYGHARLAASGDEPSLVRRHRDWYLGLIEAADREWGGSQQQQWASRLQVEHANVRRGLEYCASEPGEARIGMRIASVLWLWLALGHLAEGKLWLDRILALDTEPSHERAWALATAGYIAATQGDKALAVAMAEQARTIASALNEPGARAFATHVLAVCHCSLTAEPAAAIPLFNEALQLYDNANVPVYPDLLRIDLALAHIFLGELGQATVVNDELFERSRSTGESWGRSYALCTRGLSALLSGDSVQAESDLHEALKIKRFFHDTLGLATTLDMLAWTAAASGDAERAATLLGAATTLWQESGAPPLTGAITLVSYGERFEKTARTKLGDRAFNDAFERGAALPTEESLTLALRERRQPPGTACSVTKLTRRESEVASLVADGLSNKAIAARLVISLRTAEGHVENILNKLGFSSRAQIASWITQQHNPAGKA
ncbi:protein kinase domain-containing protein [Mycolicibacterium sp. CBMA 226]|uniref:protein kinase domain-containing protein n=1 Tax=Mycolicibacterium sp. CBMA 226 TaxID=2606611 RepID=UPI001316711C|nr:protein kinase [Mycolicibacterium sp. CBMA 226]QGW61386.1 Serine/threonine-protein kinase PknK [Mycolicibacterium sp.]